MAITHLGIYTEKYVVVSLLSSIGGTGYSSFLGGNLIKVGGGIN